MATNYPVRLEVTLTPRINITPPEVIVSVPGYITHETLWKTKRIDMEFIGSAGFLNIKFINKNYNESTDTKDMAVIVDKIEFFGIGDPRFVWAGVYTPEYPEPWLSQQTPQPSPTLTNHNYLGWNGTWRLEFGVPVFSWMHQTLAMGWTYN